MSAPTPIVKWLVVRVQGPNVDLEWQLQKWFCRRMGPERNLVWEEMKPSVSVAYATEREAREAAAEANWAY